MFIINNDKEFKFQDDAENYILDFILNDERKNAEEVFDNYINEENGTFIIKGLYYEPDFEMEASAVLRKFDLDKYNKLFEEWLASTVDNIFEVAHNNDEGAKLTNNEGTDFITVVEK